MKASTLQFVEVVTYNFDVSHPECAWLSLEKIPYKGT